VQRAAPVAQQRRRLLLGRAVGVHLDEHPVWLAGHADPLPHPRPHARRRRRIVGGDGRILDARHQRAIRPQRERQRALDHQDAIVAPLADARRAALLVGAPPGQVPLGPVDPVDDRGLRFVRRAGT